MGPTFIKLVSSCRLAPICSRRPTSTPWPGSKTTSSRSRSTRSRRPSPPKSALVSPRRSSPLTPPRRRSRVAGQVHRAVLRDGRPEPSRSNGPVCASKWSMTWRSSKNSPSSSIFTPRWGAVTGSGAMVEEFRRSIMAELDYRQEAANLRVLASNLADFDLIVVPQSIDDYTASLVLTMESVDGRNVGSLGPLARQDIDGFALAAQLFDCYLDQILVDGFVHADPHPGNVLLTTDGRLALIDLGMVARVSPPLQDALVRLLLALSEGHGSEVAAVMAGLGEKRDGWEPARFEREVISIVQQNQTVVAGQLESGRVVGELARIAGECRLRPPAELTILSKALLNLDQVASKLDPDFDPNAAVREHVGEIMRRKMLQSASAAHLLAAAMDAKEFVEKLPGRVNKVIDALAEGQLTLNVQGIDKKELIRGVQKLANRVTTGLIIAALIIGVAMLMRIDTKSKLLGYPSVAIVCFLAAAVAGVWLILTTVMHDLPQRRRRR